METQSVYELGEAQPTFFEGEEDRWQLFWAATEFSLTLAFPQVDTSLLALRVGPEIEAEHSKRLLDAINSRGSFLLLLTSAIEGVRNLKYSQRPSVDMQRV